MAKSTKESDAPAACPLARDTEQMLNTSSFCLLFLQALLHESSDLLDFSHGSMQRMDNMKIGRHLLYQLRTETKFSYAEFVLIVEVSQGKYPVILLQESSPFVNVIQHAKNLHAIIFNLLRLLFLPGTHVAYHIPAGSAQDANHTHQCRTNSCRYPQKGVPRVLSDINIF